MFMLAVVVLCPPKLVVQNSGPKVSCVQTTESCEKRAKTLTMLTMYYIGTLEDSAKSDSSYDVNEPLKFPIDVREVVKC